MVFFSLGFFFRWIALSYLSRWMMLNVFSLRIFKMNLKFASLTFFFALSSTCWWEKTLNAPSTVIDCNIYLWHAFHWQSDLLLVLFFCIVISSVAFFFYFFFAGSVRHWWKPIDLNWSLEGNGFNHELSSQHLNISFFLFIIRSGIQCENANRSILTTINDSTQHAEVVSPNNSSNFNAICILFNTTHLFIQIDSMWKRIPTQWDTAFRCYVKGSMVNLSWRQSLDWSNGADDRCEYSMFMCCLDRFWLDVIRSFHIAFN